MKTASFIILFGFFGTGISQNLISNPGFEEVTGCPGANIYLQNTDNWRRIKEHRGTPDQFYGDCPYNGIVNPMAPGQLPFDGIGYAGGFCHGDNLREYLTVELSDPMVKDSLYEIAFYVLPATGYGTMINSYGVHFSIDEPKGEGSHSLAVVPLKEHVGNPANNMINDTVNWTKISGKYRAKGGERYATFGNFRTDSQTKSEVIKMNCVRHDRSYVLIDGVTVKKADWKSDHIDGIKPDDMANRDMKVKCTFRTEKAEIRLKFWDHQQPDGDTVIVMLKDEVLLNNFPITKRKEKLELELHPGVYELKLVAVNLGTVPPNTCSVLITDGKEKRVIVLNSTLGKTECIRIVIE